jgi:hypothetical protein
MFIQRQLIAVPGPKLNEPGQDDPRRLGRGANQRARSQAWASHANAAAHRAAISTTTDHPARGDARVVRRTARCGNVDDDETEPHPCSGRANGAQQRSDPRRHGAAPALGVPLWLCALGILAMVLQNRKLRKRYGDVAVRVLRPGKKRWARDHAIWVSDVVAWARESGSLERGPAPGERRDASGRGR